jgi:hypothetical protein
MYRMMMRLLIVLAVMAALTCAAFAQGIPASKATFAYDKLVALQASCASGIASPDCSTPDRDWETILRQKIKMANQKDLFIDASLQCGLITDTTVKSLNVVTDPYDASTARATIRVRVKITGPNGSITYAEPNSGVDATNTYVENDGIVFCDRVQTLKAKFGGMTCSADLTTGVVTCQDPEELELILKTLNANSFNFVAANLAASGVYTIDVQAKTNASVSIDSNDGSLGGAQAFIGAGSVAIESVRMIKDATGQTLVEFTE